MSACTRPQDVPALRSRLLDFVVQYGEDVIRNKLDGGNDPFYTYLRRQKLKGPDPLGGIAKAFAIATAEFLQCSELFFVRAEMVRLAVAAGESLPGFTITREDLPAPEGFIVFETPIHTRPQQVQRLVLDGRRDRSGAVMNVEVDIVGVSWYEFENSVHLVWWEDVRSPEGGDPRIPLNWGMEMNLPYGTEQKDIYDPDTDTAVSIEEERRGRFTLSWITTLKSVWLLMQQDLSTVEDARFDRAAHRRAAREGRTVPRVRVIALRRSGHGSGEGGSVEWHHRWIVRGHWRQQWYPSREVHRPVWIKPHAKGPDDAPLLVGEKVYDLRR